MLIPVLLFKVGRKGSTLHGHVSMKFKLRKHSSAIYNDFFTAVKMKKKIDKILINFLIFAQNIDCGYTLEPPLRRF